MHIGQRVRLNHPEGKQELWAMDEDENGYVPAIVNGQRGTVMSLPESLMVQVQFDGTYRVWIRVADLIAEAE